MTPHISIPVSEIKNIFRNKLIPTHLFVKGGDTPKGIRSTISYNPLRTLKVNLFFEKVTPSFWDRLLKRERFVLIAADVPGWGFIVSDLHLKELIDKAAWDINVDHLDFKYRDHQPVWALPKHFSVENS